MPPRRTRTATMEQSIITTRSRKQKMNNSNKDETTSTAKRQKRKTPVKSTSKISIKQNTETNSPNVKITSSKSVQKKSSRQKRNYKRRTTIEDISTSKENEKIDEPLTIKDEDNIRTKRVVKKNISQQNTSQGLTSHKVTNKKSQRNVTVTNVKSSPIIVTPKSTPPKLSLTPHRSKKTPKKSPVSLGSPKTHSLAVPKLLRSPRKLSLVTCKEDLDGDTDYEKSQKSKKDSLDDTATSKKNLSLSSIVKSKHRKSSRLNLKSIVHILSKSPKEKYSKTKKPNLKLLSPSQVRKSLSQISSGTRASESPSTLATVRIDRISTENLLASKCNLLDSKLPKVLTVSQVENMLPEPIVLLEKLPLEINQGTLTDQTKLSNILIKENSLSTSMQNRSKMSTPETFTKSEAIHNSNTKSRNNSAKGSSKIKHDTLMQRTDTSPVPLKSSTPQENKMSMDIKSLSNIQMESINNASFNIKLRSRSNTRSPSILNSIDNVSQPSLFDVSVRNASQSKFPSIAIRNDTYNMDSTTVAKKQERKNNTYELEQPQTLNLRQMIGKHTPKEINSHENIKRAKVHFVDVTSDANAHKISSKPSKLPLRKLHNINANRSSATNSSAHKSRRNEIAHLSRNSFASPLKRRSPRASAATPKTRLSGVETPKTLKSIRKQSDKKSSTKKVPNFGRIHERLFARSESLVDAKKRLEDRHVAFATNKALSKAEYIKKEEKKPLLTGTNDGTHNRFGFKLRKPEATHLVLKKETVFSRETKKQEARTMLKQVRTNRRFELQMKARNLVA